jgi:hypothetical protein
MKQRLLGRAEAQGLLTLMSECNKGRAILSGSDGRVFVSRTTAIEFALELAARKVAEALATERARIEKERADENRA